jgi:hypothetical protein
LRLAKSVQKYEEILENKNNNNNNENDNEDTEDEDGKMEVEESKSKPNKKKSKKQRKKENQKKKMKDAKNCVTIINTTTYVDIKWQDATITRNIKAIDLIPVNNQLDEDFW